MKIMLRRILHRQEYRIGIFSEISFALNELLQRSGAVYSRTHKCWHLPATRAEFLRISELLKGYKLEVEKPEVAVHVYQTTPETPPPVQSAKSPRREAKTRLPDLLPANRLEVNRMVQQLQLKGLSENTLRTYRNEFIIYLKHIRHIHAPDMPVQRIKDYLQYCYATLHLSENTIHSRINALKFYYEQVLGREKFFWEIPRPKKHLQLPRVISEEKILQGLLQLRNAKHRVLLVVAYSAGLRVSEVVHLRITDVDADRMQLFIERGKGKKDRVVSLSSFALQLIREYISAFKPAYWLFEGENKKEPYSVRSAQQIFHDAYRGLGLPKSVTFHSLRHSYATHLLEQGTDIRYIQALLGHNDIKTTLRYTHVSTNKVTRIESPLDKIIRQHINGLNNSGKDSGLELPSSLPGE